MVEYLLRNNAGFIRVLDNLSNGYLDNIKDFLKLPNFEFIEGDIRNFQTCVDSIKNIDYVSHQAALGSVPRSIEDPILTNSVNIDGFLNILAAAKDSKKVKKLIFAASSSTYGDSEKMPKAEGEEGSVLSPYAVTKAVNEIYADVFSRIYKFNTIGLRYFNVFGPKQNSNNPYAAVIPLFCKQIINGQSPVIFGDGNTSRDFTYIENVIQANIKAFEAKDFNKFEVFNVACGMQTSLNDIIVLLNKISGKEIKAIYQTERKGDVKHSLANINKIINQLNYNPSINFETGLKIVFEWYKKNI